MKLHDLSHGNKLELASKAVESFFDKQVNISTLSESKARKALSSVQRLLSEVRSSHRLHTSEQNPKYLQAVMLEQALRARIAEAGTVGTVGTSTAGTTNSGGIASTTKSLAVIPPPKPHEIQQRIQQTKDPKMKELLRKAAGGQQISTDDQKKLATLAADQAVNEDREYSIRYVQEDDVWAVVDSVGNRVESFIDKHEAVQAARKLNAGKAKAPNRHRHVNYRGDLEEGKLDDLKDKKAEKDDWFDAKTKKEPAKKKVAGKQYGGSKQKDDAVTESATLRKVATAKLVEFYRKHRASGSNRVKMVESELFRRKRVVESKRNGRKLVTESEVQQAQVVLAAQDMVDQIQKMIEQASSAQFKDLPALVSQIRLEQGPDQSSQFNQAVTAAFTTLLQALSGAKEQMVGAVDVVTGKAPAGPTINPGDAAPAPDATADAAPSTADAEAGLDLDDETADITGFGRERR